MRVAALCDIHGNLPALEAVLDEIRAAEVDAIVIGGDVASGPMPAETLALARSLAPRVHFVRGNADRVLDFGSVPPHADELWIRRRRWVAESLGDEALGFLAELPLGVTFEVTGLGPTLFCHGAPGSDVETITRLTPEDRLAGLLARVRERVVVCGHTHVQFDRLVGGVRVVNAGSVGFPYEAEPGAYWLLAGPEISLRRTTYDVDGAVKRLRAAGYPGADADSAIGDLAVRDPSRPERMSALIEGLPPA